MISSWVLLLADAFHVLLACGAFTKVRRTHSSPPGPQVQKMHRSKRGSTRLSSRETKHTGFSQCLATQECEIAMTRNSRYFAFCERQSRAILLLRNDTTLPPKCTHDRKASQ